MKRKLNVKQLRIEYDAINFGYFSNKLPTVPIEFSDNMKKGDLGHTVFDFGTRQPIKIVLRRTESNRDLIITLIHEMIHVKLYSIGGSRFGYNCKAPKTGKWSRTAWSKEIRRLASEGLFDYLI